MPSTEAFVPGRTVRLTNGGVTGTLVSLKGARAEIETDLGRIKVNLSDLVATEPRVSRRSGSRVEVAVHFDADALDDELDLHQCRVADVDSLLSQFISQALVRGLRRIRIIHGKGSGKLRIEVQRLLKRNKCIGKFEYADVREGSYGATVAWLK